MADSYLGPKFPVDAPRAPIVLPGADSAETVYNYGARYEWSGGLGGPGYTRGQMRAPAGDPFDQYFDTERKNARERAVIQQVTDPNETVAQFLDHGYHRLVSSVVDAARANDRGLVESGLQRIRDFRDQHLKDLRDWAVNGSLGGESAKKLASVAKEILTDGFMSTPVATGYNGRGEPSRVASVQTFLDSGVNSVADAATEYLMNGGYDKDIAEIRTAASLGDVDEVRAVVDRMRQTYKDNQSQILQMVSYGSETKNPLMIDAVAKGRKLIGGEYLQDEVDLGVDDAGHPVKYTVAQMLTGAPDKFLERSASAAAGKYGVDRETAMQMVDPRSEMYGLFRGIKDDIVSGEVRQRQPGGDVQRAVRQVERGRAALKLIGDHFAKVRQRDVSFDDLVPFYKGAYDAFGMELSREDLDTMFTMYQNASQSPTFRPGTFFQDLQQGLNTAFPMMSVPAPVDPGDPNATRSVQMAPSIWADRGRLRSQYFRVSEILGPDHVVPPSQLGSALKLSAGTADVLEQQLGADLDTVGLGNAVAYATAYQLSGENPRYTGPDNAAFKLGQLRNCVARTAAATKPGDMLRGQPDDGYLLVNASEAAARAVSLAYARRLGQRYVSFEDYISGKDSAEGDALQTATDAVGREFGRELGLSPGVAGKLARMYIDNLRDGTQLSLTDMVGVVAGRKELVRSSDGARSELVTTTPGVYVSPRDGSPSRIVDQLAGNESRGMFSTTPSRYTRLGAAESSRAKQAMRRIARGEDPLSEGGGEEKQAVRNLAASTLEIQKGQARRGHRDDARIETNGQASDAGQVLFANMRDQLDRAIKVSGTGEVVNYDNLPAVWNFIRSGDFIRFREGHDKATGVGSGDGHILGSAMAAVQDAVLQLDQWDRDGVLDQHQAEARVLADVVSEVIPLLSNRRSDRLVRGEAQLPSAASYDWEAARARQAETVLSQWGLYSWVEEEPGRNPLGSGRFSLGSEARQNIDDNEVEAYRSGIRKAFQVNLHLAQYDFLESAGYHKTNDGERDTHNDYGGLLAVYENLHRADLPGAGGGSGVPDSGVPGPGVAGTGDSDRQEALRLLNRAVSSDVYMARIKDRLASHLSMWTPTMEGRKELRSALEEPVLGVYRGLLDQPGMTKADAYQKTIDWIDSNLANKVMATRRVQVSSPDGQTITGYEISPVSLGAFAGHMGTDNRLAAFIQSWQNYKNAQTYDSYKARREGTAAGTPPSDD